MNFALIGEGTISQKHKLAIEHVGGRLCRIYDPKFSVMPWKLNSEFFKNIDYVVICSPTFFHREQTKMALAAGCNVICEKPLCLPWEPLIDDNRVNVCLQLRYLDGLPEFADTVVSDFWRNKEFFNSWKGSPLLAGGNIYEFFIHYIDLAIQLGADFTGIVNLGDGQQVREILWTEKKTVEELRVIEFDCLCEENAKPFFLAQPIYDGKNMRYVCPEGIEYYIGHKIDIMKADIQDCYNRMYLDIINGGGIKPRDIFYLTWVLHRLSDELGYAEAGIGKRINLTKQFMREGRYKC